METTFLIIPGYGGSDPGHWQSLWQQQDARFRRVEQRDWWNPVCDEWVETLKQAVAASGPQTVLVAHSLGCGLVAHWAAQAPLELLRRVRGALLVAPADVERPGCPEPLRNFAPMPRDLLPFPSLLVGSDNDAAASALRAMELARAWGSEAAILSGAGHINVKSGHRYWEQGFGYLYRLQSRIEQQARLRA